MKSGPRDTLIVIQKMDEVPDGIGTKQVWANHLEAWASVNYGTGSERRLAGQEVASVTATFQIPSSIAAREITPTHRLFIKSVGENSSWDIISAVPFRDNVGVDITAKQVSKNG